MVINDKYHLIMDFEQLNDKLLEIYISDLYNWNNY